MHYAQLQLQNLLERCETVITSSYNCCCFFCTFHQIAISCWREREGEGEGEGEGELLPVKGIEHSQIRQPQHCIPCHTVMVGDLVRRVSAPATKAKFDWISCSYLAWSFSPSCICCCLVLINCCMFYQIMISYKCLVSTFQKHADVTVQQLYITKGVYIT